MKFKLFTLFLIVALFLSACTTSAVAPSAQVMQACSIGNPQKVTDASGTTWDCGSVRTAFPAAPTSTPAPAAPAVATSAPAATAAPASNVNGFISVKYDETVNSVLTPGQTKIIAAYLREAMGAGGTQKAMEAAIASIQKEAAAVKATVIENKTLKLDQHQGWLVWCPNKTVKTDFPTDTSDVFDKLRNGPGMIWIQVPFDQNVPIRGKGTFSDCNDGNANFWAVAVH